MIVNSRLDRLTSGILIFAKTKSACQRLQRELKNNLISKEYICRVLGEFPE